MILKSCLGWCDVEESICRNIRHFSSHHKAHEGVGVCFSSKRFKSDSSLWSFLFLARIIKMICCALLDYGNNHVRGQGEERLTLERRRGVSGADGGSQPQKNPYYASTKAERCSLVKTLKRAPRDHDQNSVRGELLNLWLNCGSETSLHPSDMIIVSRLWLWYLQGKRDGWRSPIHSLSSYLPLPLKEKVQFSLSLFLARSAEEEGTEDGEETESFLL